MNDLARGVMAYAYAVCSAKVINVCTGMEWYRFPNKYDIFGADDA